VSCDLALSSVLGGAPIYVDPAVVLPYGRTPHALDSNALICLATISSSGAFRKVLSFISSNSIIAIGYLVLDASFLGLLILMLWSGDFTE
jgi:hypothetical protein